jgi:DNA repair exonuclease SbcCD ATPase subunit
MKSPVRSTLVLILFVVSLTGCTLPRRETAAPTVTPAPTEVPSITPDVNSTVNAAVSGTEAAKNAMQTTIDSSVAKTVTAIPPKPTPTLMNISNVTEEEVSAMVEKEVDEAMQASAACAQTTTTATADDSLTAEELNEIEAAIYASEVAIDEANALAEQYLALYSDVSEEMVAVLQQMESELASVSQSTAEISATLDEINTTLQQGLTLAEDTINQLETQAAEIQSQAAEVKTKVDEWKNKVPQELDNRANQIVAIQPDQIATDRQGTVNQLSQYIGQLKTSVADGKISSAELLSIGKSGANTSASLKQFGDAGSALAGKIDGLTRCFARGEMPQAMTGLKDIESNFSSLSGSLRDFSAPSLPKPPSRK